MATKNEPEAVVRTECLCQFVETLQSPWSPAAWSSCADLDLNLEPGTQTYFAFDVTPRRNHAALVAAQVLPNSKIAVGLVQEWKSETAIDDLEMANGVAEWCRMYDVTEIQFSKNTGSAVASRLNAAGILAKAIDGRDFALACDQLLNAMEAGRITHGHNGLLIPYGKKDAWYKAVRKFVNEPDYARSLAMQLSKDVRERFDISESVGTSVD